MHPVLALLIAMSTATSIVGAVMLIRGILYAPEGFEDDTGFWLVDDREMAEPVRISNRSSHESSRMRQPE